jgi:hypothetical protein
MFTRPHLPEDFKGGRKVREAGSDADTVAIYATSRRDALQIALTDLVHTIREYRKLSPFDCGYRLYGNLR